MSADRGDDNSAVRDVAEWGHQGKLSRGFEIVVTTAIFAAVGWLIDRWLGTTLLFTLGLGVFCFSYLVWSTVRQYIAEMEAHDAALPSRQATPAQSAPPTISHDRYDDESAYADVAYTDDRKGSRP